MKLPVVAMQPMNKIQEGGEAIHVIVTMSVTSCNLDMV